MWEKLMRAERGDLAARVGQSPFHQAMRAGGFERILADGDEDSLLVPGAVEDQAARVRQQGGDRIENAVGGRGDAGRLELVAAQSEDEGLGLVDLAALEPGVELGVLA